MRVSCAVETASAKQKMRAEAGPGWRWLRLKSPISDDIWVRLCVESPSLAPAPKVGKQLSHAFIMVMGSGGRTFIVAGLELHVDPILSTVQMA